MKARQVLAIASLVLSITSFVSAETLLREQVTAKFELLDASKNIVRADDFRDQFVLLAFGFTHCQHICPLMAANMGRALRLVDEPATGIFISVDTERDTPQIVDAYAKRFGANMLGLSGSYAQIVTAAKNFGVSFVVTKSDDAYTVQHTPSIFLIDPQGSVVDVFPLNASADKMAEAMR